MSYWKCRREVFGDEKYLLPMTLSGALCDDITALETGFCCLLPRLDQSGRQLVFWEPRRHTKEGYTSESMVRGMGFSVLAVIVTTLKLMHFINRL